jgi:hypothetical protein
MDDQNMGTETQQGEQSAPTMETSQEPRGKRTRQKSKEQLLAEGWKKLSEDALKTLVSELWNELGGKTSLVWKELNRRKTLTPRSAMWSYQNLRSYLEKNPDIKKKRRAAKQKDTKTARREKTVKTPRRVEEVAGATIHLDSRAPMWKEDLESDKTSVYAKKELLERAKEKAKKEKLKTGGTLSSLCAVLLWHYIGCPQDLVETE